MALSFQTGNANDPFRSVANPTGSWAVLLNHFMVSIDSLVASHSNSERIIWSRWLVPLLLTAFHEG